MSNQFKKNPSIIFAGHFAVDNIIRYKHLSKSTIGGSVSYASLALKAYTPDVKISILSHIGKKKFNHSLLDLVKDKGIDLRGIKYSDVENTNFVLDYFDHARSLTLKSRSPNLSFKDIPQEYINNPPDVIVLVPLCNEITFEYVSQIYKLFPNVFIGVDLQGFIRSFNENGKVFYTHNKQAISNLNKIIELIGDKLILKGSEEEMKLLANEYEDLNKVMRYFTRFDNNAIFIMTLGEKGSMLYRNGNTILNIPAFKPKKVTDETGAGDVYLSIFLYEFLNVDKSWDSIESIALLASAAASFLIEKKGPSGFVSKMKVLERVNRKNYII